MKCRQAEFIKSFFTLAVITILLVILLVVYFESKGWFSYNRSAVGDNIGINALNYDVSAEYYVYNSDKTTALPAENGIFNVSNVKPGEKYYFGVKFYNNESKEINTDVSFFKPDGQHGGTEEPFISENKYYYLSTQLRITNIFIHEGNSVITSSGGLNKYLMNLDDKYYSGGYPLFAGIDNAVPPPESLNILTATLPANSISTIMIEITYVKSNVNQNKFKNFGIDDSHGKCTRVLTCAYY